ncbi:Rho guanyl nucleotide exchange factor [Metarhizium album ARSEF 1941]|uniref:Rho guanyl nucleotide exchange factor n=1 Tax=Metarhizium album (strain ARSEF 1941) TaxID=1081103 RepID=A0A0B2X324_METAS|nr:Rho guanyl nucleotide exchange factor [Metarhizium album ARSEF 1941]KHO00158.1 Rho guanyl nucleotide exchange factor [Metarhizium album ARSEF 1941]
MSFRADDQRRYGSVPPVQYAVAGQQQDQHGAQQASNAPGLGRRPSFNTGDDAGYYVQGHGRSSSFGRGGEDELFLTGVGRGNSHISRCPSASGAMAGYQHRYQDATPPNPSPSGYNPQNFAPPSNSAYQRSPVSTLPYHPTQRFSTSSAGSYNTPSPPATNYTPQAYNPAAYAAANSNPQRQASHHGYGYAAHDQSYVTAAGTAGSPSYGHSPSASHTSTFSQPARSPSFSSGFLPTSPSSFTGSNPVSQTPTYDPSTYLSSTHYYSYGSNGVAPYPTSTNQTQLPYPNSSHIPVGPNYTASNEDNPYYNRHRSDSQTSPRTSPYMQPQSSPGLQRHPTNAPLPSRPMEDVPEEITPWDERGRPLPHDELDDEIVAQETIIHDIEAELGGSGYRSQHRRSPIGSQVFDGSASAHSPASRTSPGRGSIQPRFDDDDDDPEGTAGVLAMQQAELDDQRFGGGTFMYSGSGLAPAAPLPVTMSAPATTTQSNLPTTPPEELSQGSDSDFGGMDLGMLSGGYAGTLAYGADIGSPPGSSSIQDGPRPLPTPGYYNSLKENHDHGAAFNNAEVDYGGTGGLQAPEAHRLSFDEGREECVSLHSQHSGTESPAKDDYQDLFYHPGLSNRPLPALPPGPGSDSSSMFSVHNSVRSQHQHAHSLNADARYYQGDGPETLHQQGGQQGLHPERSVSLGGHSHTPQIQAPARSRTDAAEERKKINRHHQITHQGPSFDYDAASAAASGAFDSITLPSGRKKRLVPSKLTASDFDDCGSPWALSHIEAWIRNMGQGEPDLKEKAIEEAITNLFVYKIPTMNVADAEALSSQVVSGMLDSQVLLPDEEWVKFGDGHISGVLWQLTGSGCYAPRLHDVDIGGRCYSHYCTRTLKKVDLEVFSEEVQGADAWHVFYKLTKEVVESRPKKEVERQNILHEIVTGEENYIKQLDIFRRLYRDDLGTRDPPIIHPDKRDKFLTAVFGMLDTVVSINKDHLLAQLKYRQQEQGPWIVGFSDLFREWIRKAKSVYTEYAIGYPRAAYMVRKEADRNLLFKRFLEDKQKDKLSAKQDWTHFLITPVQRLQRYILLLQSVEHKTVGDSEEKTILQKAIQEIQTVTLECDAKVAETNKRVQMMELDRMLVLRPGFQSVLNLDHLGRVLIMQGELQRMGSKGMRWVDSHALLFDHYLILAKVVVPKDGRGERKYDVSREPIPMPLLFLESMNDEPVMKQKGLTAPLGRTTAAPVGAQPNKVGSNGAGRPGLEHASTGSSGNQLVPTASNDAEGKILYPFKVKHLGHEVYTLYASSARDRLDWCNSIIDAKTRHAKALYAQNAEPFRLRVLADAAFHYDANSVYARASGVPVKGTPLDRAIQDLEKVLGSAQGIAAVCRAQVNCATGFSAFGRQVIAIGTDYGVFTSDPLNPRGWVRSIQITRVTQIAVLEEFSVFLVIADKSLISYPLDVLVPVSEFSAPVNDSSRRAPQRLAKDVTYFATARLKERLLVFYKRKEGLNTFFKVLEPIFHKATEKKSRFYGGRKSAVGSTDTYRDFDEFYLPAECFSLNIFHNSFAVATSKGVEILSLDQKRPMSIPNLNAPAIANIAGRIRDQRPLGVFRLSSKNEFIVTYEDCAVYVDEVGNVSRTLIMEYTGKQKKARGATKFQDYLLLFNEDYVEVRNAENGRLRQIIAGRDVRVIDLGVDPSDASKAASSQQAFGPNGQSPQAGHNSKVTVKVAMCHPELPGRQIVLEMLLNDGHSES